MEEVSYDVMHFIPVPTLMNLSACKVCINLWNSTLDKKNVLNVPLLKYLRNIQLWIKSQAPPGLKEILFIWAAKIFVNIEDFSNTYKDYLFPEVCGLNIPLNHSGHVDVVFVCQAVLLTLGQFDALEHFEILSAVADEGLLEDFWKKLTDCDKRWFSRILGNILSNNTEFTNQFWKHFVGYYFLCLKFGTLDKLGVALRIYHQNRRPNEVLPDVAVEEHLFNHIINQDLNLLCMTVYGKVNYFVAKLSDEERKRALLGSLSKLKHFHAQDDITCGLMYLLLKHLNYGDRVNYIRANVTHVLTTLHWTDQICLVIPLFELLQGHMDANDYKFCIEYFAECTTPDPRLNSDFGFGKFFIQFFYSSPNSFRPYISEADLYSKLSCQMPITLIKHC